VRCPASLKGSWDTRLFGDVEAARRWLMP